MNDEYFEGYKQAFYELKGSENEDAALAILRDKLKIPLKSHLELVSRKEPQMKVAESRVIVAETSSDSMPCPNCRVPTRYIVKYNRYWCDSCRSYV